MGQGLEKMSAGQPESAAMQRAARLLSEEAQLRWGQDRVHVSGSDAMESLAQLALGPDIYSAIGAERSQALARESVVLVSGIWQGLAAEAVRRDSAQMAREGCMNASLGSSMATIAESHPLAMSTVATVFSAAWLFHQFGPDNSRRNNQLQQVIQSTWSDKHVSLSAQARAVAALVGNDLFETGFAIGTGAVGHGFSRPFLSGEQTNTALSSCAFKKAYVKVGEALPFHPQSEAQEHCKSVDK